MSVTKTTLDWLGVTLVIVVALLIFGMIPGLGQKLADALKNAMAGIGKGVGEGAGQAAKGAAEGVGSAISDGLSDFDDWVRGLFGLDPSPDSVPSTGSSSSDYSPPTWQNDYVDGMGNPVHVEQYDDGTKQTFTDYTSANGGGYAVEGDW